MIEDNDSHYIDDPMDVVNAKPDFNGLGEPVKPYLSQKRGAIAKAYRTMQRIDELQDFAGKLYARFSNIDKDTPKDKVYELFYYIVDAGYKDLLFDSIKGIREKVYDEINRLEKELDEI